MSKRPSQMKLVSVTVCNNRQRVIERMVESVAPYVDEVIILDTGITDDTLKLAKERCASLRRSLRIVPFLWVNDFSAARNAALKAAADADADWAFMLDSDEWFEDNGDSVRDAIAEAERTGVRHIALPHKTNQYLQPRFFKLPASGAFSGKTHEAYSPFMPALTMAKARFHDDDKTPEELREKCERDLEILKRVTTEEPEAARWWYYLGDTYYNLGDKANAMVAFEKCASIPDSWDEQRAWSCYRLAAIQCERQEWAHAVDSAALGLTYHAGIAELAWLAAYASHQAGKMAQCVCWASISVALGKHEGIGKKIGRVSFTYPMAQWEGPYQLMTSAYRAMGQNREAEKCAVKFTIAQRYRNAADGGVTAAQTLAAPETSTHPQEIDATGFWKNARISDHAMDSGLVRWLRNYLSATETVYDFGCGVGMYCKALTEAGFTCVGFEGDPPTAAVFSPIHRANLTQPMPDPEPDWLGHVLCLEVAEHIPSENETVFLDNITKHCKERLVLSWAVPGQNGDGHVNCKPSADVIALLQARGFTYLSKESNEARAAVTELPWLRNTIMIFSRRRS